MDIIGPGRIALVEEDAATATSMVAMLRAAGRVCRRFPSARVALREMERERFALLIVACTMEDVPVTGFLAEVRSRLGFALPVIALAEAGDAEDVVAALDAGADECLVRPVASSVLLAQINASLRRASSVATRIEAVVGHLSFQPEGTRVYVDGLPVTLTAKEYTLALLLCHNLAKPLTREHLLEAVWDNSTAPLTRTLDVHMSRIRTKLMLRPDHGFRLTALYGRGYRLDPVSPAAAPIVPVTPRRSVSPSVLVAA